MPVDPTPILILFIAVTIPLFLAMTRHLRLAGVAFLLEMAMLVAYVLRTTPIPVSPSTGGGSDTPALTAPGGRP